MDVGKVGACHRADGQSFLYFRGWSRVGEWGSLPTLMFLYQQLRCRLRLCFIVSIFPSRDVEKVDFLRFLWLESTELRFMGIRVERSFIEQQQRSMFVGPIDALMRPSGSKPP